MSYEVTAYDNTVGDPVAVLVAKGTHDVSRLCNLLAGGVIVVEQLQAGKQLLKQVRRHNQGRAALALLKQHGGPDLTVDKSADDDTRAVEAVLLAAGNFSIRQGSLTDLNTAVDALLARFDDRITDLAHREAGRPAA